MITQHKLLNRGEQVLLVNTLNITTVLKKNLLNFLQLFVKYKITKMEINISRHE